MKSELPPKQPARGERTNPRSPPATPDKVVVIGTSAGGLDALKRLVPQLAADLSACILIVKHVAPQVSVQPLARILGKPGTWDVREAQDGDPLVAGRIYLAPADRHMLVDERQVWITTGPRESRWRPAIDALFRSAAVAHGPRAIGVVLTGWLDDGTAGLVAIQRCGGVCIVQDPADAQFPDMPAHARARIEVDHQVPLERMGSTLEKAIRAASRDPFPPPEDLKIEARFPARGGTAVEVMDGLGERTPLTCTECGGALWRVGEGGFVRFRCHTGHAFTASALEAAHVERFEEVLWVALRMLEERRNLLGGFQNTAAGGGSVQARLEDTTRHIETLRLVLLGEAAKNPEPRPTGGAETPDRGGPGSGDFNGEFIRRR